MNKKPSHLLLCYPMISAMWTIEKSKKHIRSKDQALSLLESFGGILHFFIGKFNRKFKKKAGPHMYAKDQHGKVHLYSVLD